MDNDHQAELKAAVAEGLLPPEEVDALRADSIRLQRSPLDLLLERGRISPEQHARLRLKLGENTMELPPRSPATGPDPITAGPLERLTSAPEAGNTSLASSGGASFPAPEWDRYQPVRFLGQGGMGRVWLAIDVQLHREVALKFVRGDDPELTRRIFHEARAQARVNHERVCKVYEVGEKDGLTFIAMQFVDGQSLSELGSILTFEQKALVMREVALGVNEAHSVGLIHRDLKPSNIMVERSSEDVLRPYVVDFGLARSWNENTTATGSVLGTPNYMSPEQARGEVNRLDRRADVYSLGATLYQLLTGKPPISGENTLEVLSRIPTEEPRPPRELDPDVPEDLGAIALRCLEKDRSARYDSALALAKDLERYLIGEPIAARAGRWYRLRRRIRKHRAIVSVGTSAALLVALAVGWSIVTRREAERVARRITEQVGRIESQARTFGLAPPHDTRRDRQAIQDIMDKLVRDEARGSGPVQYALGRGYLALDENAKALEVLRSAWDHGFQEPQVAYALGLALGREYQEKLNGARAIQDSTERQARWIEIQQRYREPVLRYLRQSAGTDVPSTDYLAALIAFYEDRYDEALAHLDAIGDTLPWFHEAAQLRGDILWRRAYARWEHGDQEGQKADLLDGRRAYEKAAEIGRSIPSIQRGLARLELFAVLGELFGEGDVPPHYERGLKAVESALKMAPDDAESLVLEAQLYRRLAEYRLNNGGEVDEPLAKALEAATAAVAHAPALALACKELAQVHQVKGRCLEEQRKDPRDELRKAVELLEGIGAADRDTDYYLSLGLAFTTWADLEDRRHEDSAGHRGKAIEALLNATRLDEALPRAWSNLGMSYLTRATAPSAPTPDEDLDKARAALDKAKALNSRYLVAHYYLGRVAKVAAGRAERLGLDPRPKLTEALAHYERALAINPLTIAARSGAGSVHFSLAEAEWDVGGDPFPELERALNEFEQILVQVPNQAATAINQAEIFARKVRFQALRGVDPTALAREAVRVSDHAASLAPDDAGPKAYQGLALVDLAEFELEHGHDPTRSLLAALKAAQTAQQKDQRDSTALRALARERALRARMSGGAGGAGASELAAAAGLYEQALKSELESWPLYTEYVELCLDWAEQVPVPEGKPAPALERARRLTDELRRKWPGKAEGRALHAWVLVLEAERNGRDQRAGLRRQAAGVLDAALEDNRNLKAPWKKRREMLEQRIASGSP